MGFDSRFYDQAERELKDIQSRNAAVLEMRIKETETRFPVTGELRRAIAATSGKLIALIADRSGDIKPKLRELELENLSLQEKLRLELVRAGYPEDYLDPIYSCRKCRDTGTYEGRLCSCFMERVKKAASDELNASSPLKLCGFDEFRLSYYDDSDHTSLGATARKIMEKNLELCRKYAEDFHLPYSSILMRGRTGLGKTHLSLSIAKTVLEKGYSVIYGSAPDLFRRIEKEHFGNSGGDTLDMLIKTDLLVLDDLGAEFESKFYVSAFYNILNDRMNSQLPTIISTNLELPELETRYGERISSRLSTMTKPIFVGSDVRMLKKQ